MAREMVRQGGRSARIQKEVHRAVGELSAEMDRATITVPMIADRAGVTPSTIYRRWGDLAQLYADVAVQRLRPIADPDDTGNVRSDVETFVTQYVEEMSSQVGRALLRDVFADSSDPANAEQCWRYTYEHLTTIRRRALARGEDPFDVEEVVDAVIAPVIYHVLFRDRDIGPDYVGRLLAQVRSLS